MDIVLGALISILGTLLFNIWSLRRTENKRWDGDRLEALTAARVALHRALGNIEAMAAGIIPTLTKGVRPSVVDSAVDKAWYSLEELAILFPDVEAEIARLQEWLLQHLSLAFTALEKKKSHQNYLAGIESLTADFQSLEKDVLMRCQSVIGISR